MRNFENFPTIEAFQNLPKQVIVKGGKTSVNEDGTAELSGIIINNLSQPIRGVRVNLVIFDPYEIPIANVSAMSNPERLDQGTIGSFLVKVEGHGQDISNYYLYATWQYDDR